MQATSLRAKLLQTKNQQQINHWQPTFAFINQTDHPSPSLHTDSVAIQKTQWYSTHRENRPRVFEFD